MASNVTHYLTRALPAVRRAAYKPGGPLAVVVTIGENTAAESYTAYADAPEQLAAWRDSISAAVDQAIAHHLAVGDVDDLPDDDRLDQAAEPGTPRWTPTPGACPACDWTAWALAHDVWTGPPAEAQTHHRCARDGGHARQALTDLLGGAA